MVKSSDQDFGKKPGFVEDKSIEISVFSKVWSLLQDEVKIVRVVLLGIV